MDYIEPALVSFISFFVIFYLFHQNEEGALGRSILVSMLLGLVSLASIFGATGYVVGILLSFLIIAGLQKYSLTMAFLALLAGKLFAYIIDLGLHRYFY